MIPKIIHYCWLSGESFPNSVQKCIDSWEIHLPDYQLVLWDYNRFPRGKSKWVDQAFDKHKYAFAADYIRLYALYNYGGIYLDSDVEVLKPFDDLLDLPYFLGAEQTPFGIEAATMAFYKGSIFIKGILDSYINKKFINDDNSLNLEPLPRIVRRYIAANYDYHLIHGKEEFIDRPNIINVFSEEFFSPKHYRTKEIRITPNTYSIHHFDGSWTTQSSTPPSSPPKKQKIPIRKYIRYHLLRPTVNIISSPIISNIFSQKFNVTTHNPILRGEISSEDIKYLTENEIDLNPKKVFFITKEKSKTKDNIDGFYPIAGIIGTSIEIHFTHEFSREAVLDYWEEEYNHLKSKRNIFIIPTDRKKNKFRIYQTLIKIILGCKKIKI